MSGVLGLNAPVPAAQPLLFPDPQPLVERLGRDFFLSLPTGPGVYLMRDAGDAVLYVGKAKNLRQRLGSYRVANLDRMGGRHLRLLRSVARIELRACPDETAALAHEAELLRTLKPPFNRAGTWSSGPRFIAWRAQAGTMEVAVTEIARPDWTVHGPIAGLVKPIRWGLGRLAWRMFNPRQSLAGLPTGWFDGQIPEPLVLDESGERGGLAERAVILLDDLFAGDGGAFWNWATEELATATNLFERTALAADLELIAEFSTRRGFRSASRAIAFE